MRAIRVSEDAGRDWEGGKIREGKKIRWRREKVGMRAKERLGE